jgi:tRNA(Ile)-lysidine synthase
MALAYLCRQLQVTKPELNLIVKAFIIDHKAREESAEEAHMVQKWLFNLGKTRLCHLPGFKL